MFVKFILLISTQSSVIVFITIYWLIIWLMNIRVFLVWDSYEWCCYKYNLTHLVLNICSYIHWMSVILLGHRICKCPTSVDKVKMFSKVYTHTGDIWKLYYYCSIPLPALFIISFLFLNFIFFFGCSGGYVAFCEVNSCVWLRGTSLRPSVV